MVNTEKIRILRLNGNFGDGVISSFDKHIQTYFHREFGAFTQKGKI